MGKDIVYDESELSVAVNHITNHVDFLSRCIEKYIELLHNLQNKGMQTEQICSEIEALIAAVEPYKTNIYDIGQSVVSKINSSMGEIGTADDFRFPGDITSAVSALLAQFL